MGFLDCTFVRGIKREHINPLVIRQAQSNTWPGDSFTLCRLASVIRSGWIASHCSPGPTPSARSP